MHWLSVGGANVYFVRSGASWVVVDAAWPKCGWLIRRAAGAVMGAGARPAAILLTHIHPDHSGSALELARVWDCPVYVHPDELPLAIATDLATVECFANPLDRWVLLPLMRLLGTRRASAMLAASSLAGFAREFDPAAPVPGLPDWTWIPTPGHTPGHTALFRAADRVLIAGDALATANLGSPWGWLLWTLGLSPPRVASPPWYTNWRQQTARASVVALARLEPRVLAAGHGTPMVDSENAKAVRAWAERLADRGPVPPRQGG